MLTGRSWINSPSLRIIQHILFWVLSFYVFLYLFKVGNKLGKIDYVYTGLFHISILPPVYINLFFLLPWLRKTNNWIAYALLTLSSIALFSWLNLSFFSDWSNTVLPVRAANLQPNAIDLLTIDFTHWVKALEAVHEDISQYINNK